MRQRFVAVICVVISLAACASNSQHRPLAYSQGSAHPIEQKAAADYNSLTEPEKVWYTVSRFIICVRDGGLISYYYNGYAEHVDDLVPSLNIIGAKSAKKLVLGMNSLFGARVPKSLDELNDAINSWSLSLEDDKLVNDNNDAEQLAATEAEALLAMYAVQHDIEP